MEDVRQINRHGRTEGFVKSEKCGHMQGEKHMKCQEVLDKLEQLSPSSFAMDWDNSGFLVGDKNAEVTRVLLALDATNEVIEEAVEKKADFLLTHHPMIFTPVKRVVTDDVVGNKILTLAKHNIGYSCMHTNFDVMGMADAVADELGLKRKSVLDITYEDDISKEGIGRIGLLPREVSLKELAETVKIKFHIPNVMLYGEGDTIVEKVAICGGSGSYAIKNAIQAGCQVYITGDITYHKALDAMEEGLSIIDAGHFGIEKLFIPYMKDFFAKELKQITVMCSEQRQIGTVI